MNAFQNRRLNQLIDKLVEHKITRSEYMEYQYLWELLSAESQHINNSLSKKHRSQKHSMT